MSAKDTVFAVEDASIRLKGAVDLIEAVHTAMSEGSYTAESYLDALFGAHLYLAHISKEISGSIQTYFDGLKKEGAESL